MKNIKEEIKRKEQELETIKEMGDIIEYLEKHERWYMYDVNDDNGETILDTEGEPYKREPEQDEYGYAVYMAYHTVKKMVEDYITKALK